MDAKPPFRAGAAAAVAAVVALLIVVVTSVARHAGTAHQPPPVADASSPPAPSGSLSTSSRRTVSALPSASLTAATGRPTDTTGTETTGTDTTGTDTSGPQATDLSFDVPWVDRPTQPPGPATPLPAKPLPYNAPPCRADQLRVSTFGSQVSVDDGIDLVFHNASQRACLLTGASHVVASGAGLPTTVLAAGSRPSPWAISAWDLAPGDEASVWVQSGRYCSYNPTGGEDKSPHFTELVVTAPGGGELTIPHVFLHRACTSVTDYGRPKPDDQYAPDPRVDLVAAVTMPPTIPAGRPFTYVISLTNPTRVAIALDPCPAYIASAGRPGVGFLKDINQLNCDTVTSIAAGAKVRYEMRATIPADAASGPLSVWWQVLVSFSDKNTGSAMGTTVVAGNDHPCTAAQLSGAAASPAVSFGGSGLYDVKDAGTSLAVVVTNTSAATCTLQGAPRMALTTADGADVGVPYADKGTRFPPLPEPQVTLAPGGRAAVNLAWHTQWCKADPNPVTVRLTLPSNGGTLSVVPAHGWTPPPCTGFEWKTISSDPFHSAG